MNWQELNKSAQARVLRDLRSWSQEFKDSIDPTNPVYTKGHIKSLRTWATEIDAAIEFLAAHREPQETGDGS